MDTFEDLKNDYLLSIKEEIEKVESIVIKESVSKDDLKEIFRVIHSIKGGAGSHELNFIGAICHNFEDYISDNMLGNEVGQDNIDHSLKFIDLLKDVIHDYIENNVSNINKHIEMLSSLRSNVNSKEDYKGHVLVVDSTTTMANIIKKGLKQYGYDCTLVKNGLNAFNRLVTDKYDALVSSLNLDQLDGISLINALKSTSNINNNIPVIVISASKNITDRFTKANQPDFIIEKNTTLLDNLVKAIESSFKDEIKVDESKAYGPQKILYVEDDPKMQKLFNLSMKKHPGVEVVFAEDEESTIKAFENFDPDVVLLDNFLKGCTGKDVFYKILDKKKPCIFLTASEGAVDADDLRKHNEFKGIITKPFRPNAIYGQITMFLKGD